MTDPALPKFMAAAKALSDENRVRRLALLRGRSLCVRQIIAVLGLAPSTVSKHLSILRCGRRSVLTLTDRAWPRS